MRNIIGEVYYYAKYYMRNKYKAKNPDSTKVYQNYAGKDFLELEELNKYVYDRVKSGKPFMMGRFGAVEMFNMRTDEFNRKDKRDKACEQLYTCAGFFPNDSALITDFNNLMKESCKQVDVLGVWQMPCEDYFIKKYCNNLEKICMLKAIEPWWSKNPWTKALEGKKVLIIHPFEDSIIHQYNNYEKLFEDANVLPKFELKTLKAVQTAGSQKDDRFSTWFEALDYMCKECEKIDFDVALLGCGAYGFPLAAHIKKMGKQAIHFGGSLQILFGIKGDRWDRFIPEVTAFYNEYWDYPLDSEVPKGSASIEGGTYWKSK